MPTSALGIQSEAPLPRGQRGLALTPPQFGWRNLGAYDRSVLALQLEGMYAAEAEKRKQATQFGNTDVQKSAPPQDVGKTRDKVAAIAGVSHDTVRKVKAIEEEAANSS